MKRQLLYILTAAVLTAGCAEKETPNAPKGYGSFRLECTATPGITDLGAKTSASPLAEFVPTGNDLKLILTGEGYKGEWTTVAGFAATDTLFLEGPYKAQVSYGSPDTEGFDKPYYTGSAEFTIDALDFEKPVSITAQIANSLVVVRATEQFIKYFHDAKFTVTTASKKVFDFWPGTDDYTGDPAYVKAATSLKVTGTGRRQSQTGTDDGQQVKFEEQTLDATVARTRHIFLFDAANAGSATLDIFIGVDENGEDRYVETRILDIELNDAAIPDPIE